jgi:hypothetical protein
MEQEEPTLKNIAKEFSTPGYWERASARKKATRTIWDLVFLPVAVAAMGAFVFAFAKFFVWIHLLVHPGDVERTQVLFSGPITLSAVLMGFVPAFSAIPLGFMTGNALMWLVPPARRASEAKAAGVKWATFRDAQMSLFKLALVLVPLGAVSGTIGALL